MAKSKYVTETIRLPYALMLACEQRAASLGLPVEDFIVYVMTRTLDDHLLALQAARNSAP